MKAIPRFVCLRFFLLESGINLLYHSFISLFQSDFPFDKILTFHLDSIQAKYI